MKVNEIIKLYINNCWIFLEEHNDVSAEVYYNFKINKDEYKLIMLQRNLPLKRKYWEIVMYILKEKV